MSSKPSLGADGILRASHNPSHDCGQSILENSNLRSEKQNYNVSSSRTTRYVQGHCWHHFLIQYWSVLRVSKRRQSHQGGVLYFSNPPNGPVRSNPLARISRGSDLKPLRWTVSDNGRDSSTANQHLPPLTGDCPACRAVIVGFGGGEVRLSQPMAPPL